MSLNLRRKVHRSTQPDRRSISGPLCLASASNSTEALSRPKVEVTDMDLKVYLIRLVILIYRVEPRFRSHDQNGTDTVRSGGGSTYLSVLNDSTPLPKEVLKIMEEDLLKMAQVKSSDTVKEAQSRRAFLAFYNFLLEAKSNTPTPLEKSSAKFIPNFRNQSKLRWNLRDLVIEFCRCTNKVRGNDPYFELSMDDLVQQLVEFLTDVLRRANTASQIYSSQLEALRSALDSELTSESSSTNQYEPRTKSMDRNTHSDRKQKPSFAIQDISGAQHMARVLMLSTSSLQKDIEECKHQATIASASQELDRLQYLIECDAACAYHYSMEQFNEPSDYNMWKDRELSRLDSVRLKLQISQNKDLSEVSSLSTTSSSTESTSQADEHQFYFIPSRPRDYFRLLLRRCLELEVLKLKKISKHSDGHVELPTLSKPSRDLLEMATNFWNIAPETTAVIYLEIYHDMLQAQEFAFDSMGQVLARVKSGSTHQSKISWATASWPLSEGFSLQRVLGKLQENLFDVIAESVRDIYDPDMHKLKSALEVFERHLQTAEASDGPKLAYPSEIQLGILSKMIEDCATNNYDTLRQNIPENPASIKPYHIVDLIDHIISASVKLKQSFPKKLLSLSFRNIAFKQQLERFAQDCPSWLSAIIKTDEQRDLNEESTLTLGELIELSNKVSTAERLYTKNTQNRNTSNAFDPMALLYPYFENWAAKFQGSATRIVCSALEKDDFQPLDESNDVMSSSSIKDVCQFFQSAIDQLGSLELHELDRSRLLSSLMVGVAAGIELYSQMTLNALTEEFNSIRIESCPPPSGSIFARARISVQPRETPPAFEFRKSSFVKLNNLNHALAWLERTEGQLDSESIARTIQAAKNLADESTTYIRSFLFDIHILHAEVAGAPTNNGGFKVELLEESTVVGTTAMVKCKDYDPYWDESFEIFTKGSKLLTVQVSVKDLNTNFTHFYKRQFLRLDPYTIKDFEARIGERARLLLRITKETEYDDIRYLFGKSMRTTTKTLTRMIDMIVSKFTTAIESSLSLQSLRSSNNVKSFGMEAVSRLLNYNNKQTLQNSQVTEYDPLESLKDYLNRNFGMLDSVLISELKIRVMTKTWKFVLGCIDNLLLPPLNRRRNQHAKLSYKEVDLVLEWLVELKDFFHHEEVGAGPPLEVLMSTEYHDILAAKEYYFMTSMELKDHFSKLSSKNFLAMQKKYSQLTTLIARSNSMLMYRNKAAMAQQRTEIEKVKRDIPHTQDIILRALRLRGEHDYVERQVRQRKNVARSLVTESMISSSYSPR